MIYRFLLFTFFFVFSLTSLATPIKIGKILIRGNKIVSKEAVSSQITSRVLNNYNVKNIRTDVKNIFNTGWFYDVQVQKITTKNRKVTLIYKVKENPIIEKIIYKGNKSISKKELKKISKLSLYEFLDHKKIKKIIKNIKTEYTKKGYYLANVTYKIKNTAHAKKVHLIVHITENKKLIIKRISFHGNKSIASEELKSFMATKEASLLSFISSSGSYDQKKLAQDLNNIRFIYMDRGYWKVFVGVPEITISADKTDLTISIVIEEGEAYRVGGIYFSKDIIFEEGYLKAGIKTQETEVFSYGTLQRDIKWLEKQYGDKGYAFVNIIPQFFSDPGDSSQTLHVNFEIQKGKKVHINRIAINGNTYTRDKVIRREIRFFEGNLYNETHKIRSLKNIERLGFFEKVKIISNTIKNTDNKVDMEVTVTERENTGALEAGAGFNGYYGFSIHGKFQRANFLGRGYDVGVNINLTSTRKQINFNFSDPYFLDSKWYFGVDFYLDHWASTVKKNHFSFCELYAKQKKEYDSQPTVKTKPNPVLCWQSFPGINDRGFSEKKISGGFTFGRSLSDILKILFNYRIEKVRLTSTIDQNIFPLKEANGVRNPLEGIVEYDTRNDRVFPTGGMYSRSSLAYDGLLGKFNYFTLSTNLRFYKGLFWDLVFRVNVKYSQHFIDDKQGIIPFDRLFLLGGINDLRGFNYYAIGPRKQSDTIYQKALQYGYPNPQRIASRIFGGTKEFFTNIELHFPIYSKLKLTGVAFLDIGSAYNKVSNIDLRSNWGLGVRFLSPLGPIRLEMGFPFKPRSVLGENNSEFHFTMGLPF